MTGLRFGVLISLALSLVLLTWEVLHARSFGKRRPLSRPKGKPYRGIIYALGPGMLPWEKESAAQHLPTYIAGVFYHLGIFAAILLSLSLAIHVYIPKSFLTLFQVAMASGLLAGVGLFFKRALRPALRFISCPDDFIANILVDIFLLAGFLSTVSTALVPFFLTTAILTFFYMPLGKIRHCFFFFYSRILFGSYFARRGILPPANQAKIRGKA